MNIEGKEKIRLELEEGPEQGIDMLESIEHSRHIKKLNSAD